MDSIKFHLNKKTNPLFKELTINRLKKNNKILISNTHNRDNNSVHAHTNIEKYKKILKENELTSNKNPLLKQKKLSEDCQNLMRKNLNKNVIHDLGDLINNLKTIKSYSINIKQKNNIITNINNNNYSNRNSDYLSIDKLSKKTIEKESDNNNFHLSSKTFNFNNNSEFSSINNPRKQIIKMHSHGLSPNANNINIDNLINKFKQYKIINKNIQKNNININLNINSIQNIQNIQNIETIDINKINPHQKLFLLKNDIFNSYLNCGKIYKEKIPYNEHFKTIQNTSHDKNNKNYMISTNANTNKNTNDKNKLNSIRDNLFKNLNNNKKNIKLNYNLLINTTNNNNEEYLPKFSSIETINNSKRTNNLKTNYNNNDNNLNINYDFSNDYLNNKTINNESIKNKNNQKKIYFRVLSGKKKKFISFGEIVKKESQNNILRNNNIYFKLSKFKRSFLPKNINPIKNYNTNSNRPKNYFNHKILKVDANKQINNNYYTIIAKNNINTINAINLINSPQEKGLKIMLKNKNFKEKINNNKIINNSIYINKNPEFVKEYTEEILINLLIEESLFDKKKKLILNSEILNNYGINPNIRSCLVDSLIGLQDTFKFCNKTLFITIKIFDNYLGSIISSDQINSRIEETDLDMVIVSCFLIASKMEESFIYHLTDYLSILSDKYTTKHLMTMEYNILKCFNFEAFEPNILDFFEIFSSFYELDDKLKKKGINILFAILLNIDLSEMPSSIIAFSVLYLLINKDFNIIMNRIDGLFYYIHKWSDWSQRNYNDKKKNEIYSKYMDLIAPLKKEKDIKDISDMILYFMENIPKTEFFNAAKKIEKI